MPIEVDLLTKKRGGKWDTVCPSSTSNIKIIFVLLANVVIFYM